ncbi:MAG: class I SAM-dependent methyltransferase [Thermoanaerobaculia bacterium]|nr:class I SAM-dependent methyltransferase [Thermoanaerobaculia bacterium]
MGDHFSRQADTYRRYRPHYPAPFLDWVAALAPRRDLAWDVGTGNGQAAVGLAPHFRRVFASDLSLPQLAAAETVSAVSYGLASAESSPLAAASVDLVTVAQALHWFEFDRFWSEVRRVLRPGGGVVAWCYERAEISAVIDPVFLRFHDETMAPYWPDRRAHVISGYRNIPFPFFPVATPGFALSSQWDLEHLLGYVASWSAVDRCRQRTGIDPLPGFAQELAAAWGPRDQVREIRWPLTVLAGRA